jgi:alkyl hydroperoxide reductase subunit AhpC
MKQVVDLQKSGAFKNLGVELLSLSPDPVSAWRDEGGGMGISLPMLSDPDNKVWLKYGTVDWMMASNEPGHTFILVDPDGKVAWVKDYGAPESGGMMYVSPDELSRALEKHLSGA